MKCHSLNGFTLLLPAECEKIMQLKRTQRLRLPQAVLSLEQGLPILFNQPTNQLSNLYIAISCERITWAL